MGNQQPVAGGPPDTTGHYGYPMEPSGGAGGPSGSSAPPNIPRASSDASMTLLDNNNHQHPSYPDPHNQQQHGSSPPSGNSTEWIDDDTVPTVFRWEHGGRHVYITGTFNDWKRQIPMHRSGNDFTYIHNLQRSKHAFKFIVDDEWRFAPDQPTVADIEGRINNFIDVSEFQAYTGDLNFEKETTAMAAEDAMGGGSSIGDDANGDNDEDSKFGTTLPDVYDNYTKEPPPLPPHLRHIILNKPAAALDTAALPVPQHVALNHLYCTAIRDQMMVLGITQRFKTKFVTTVYYAPCASK